MARRPSRFQLRLALICVVGLVLRVAYVVVVKRHQKLWGDAYVYQWQAHYLLRGHGFVVPYQANYHAKFVAAADEPPLWTLTLAGFDLLGFTTFNEHKVLACFIGAATVVAIGMLGRRVAGERVGLLAAAIAALYSNFWANDGLGQSETLVLLAVTLTVLAAYRCWQEPTWRRAAVLGVGCGACSLIHPDTLLLAPLLGLPLLWRAAGPARVRAGLVAVVALASVLTISPWVARNLAQFQKPVFLSDGADITLAATNCDPTYSGQLLGYWSISCSLNVAVPPGDQSVQYTAYRKAALDYISAHKRRLPAVVAARLGRAFGLYRPIQMTHFDVIEGRELWVNRLGLVSYYGLALLALAGAVVLRRRRVALWPLGSLVVVSAAAVILAFGNTRYRVTTEIAIAVLAAVAVDAAVAAWTGRWRATHPAHPLQGDPHPEPVAGDTVLQGA